MTPMLSYYASYLQLRVALSWAFGSAVGRVGELSSPGADPGFYEGGANLELHSLI